MALTKVKASNITLTTAAANSNDTTPATTQYVTTAINNLIDGAPATLNTLDEIAAALNDDAALNTTLTNAIAAKAPLAGPTFTGDVDIDGSDDVRLRFLRGSTFKGGIQVPTSTGDMISGAAIDDLAIRSQANMLFSAGGNTERMRIDSTGNVGIGTDSPNANLEITQSGNNVGLLVAGGGYNYTAKFESVDAEANIIIEDSNSTNDGNMIGVATNDMYFITDTAERMRIDSSGNVGIGTSAIMQDFGDGRTTLALKGTGIADYSTLQLGNYGTSSNDQIHGLINFYDGTTSVSRIQSVRASNTSDAHLAFYTAPSSGGIEERARLTSDGNLLVGKTSSSYTTVGAEVKPNGRLFATASGDTPLLLNRLSADGTIANFRKDGTTVGSIGTASGVPYFAGPNANTGGFRIDSSGSNGVIIPTTTTGANRDAATDLGYSSVRWKDIYRSGSTYQTSDRNMKQDIRDLTDAERNVAVACKGLLKAFRFIDAVEKDGDDANIHFGVIAQELAEAFEAEGLDANDYQVYKSATTTDEDGNEQTRLNVCYENLLAFIISAI